MVRGTSSSTSFWRWSAYGIYGRSIKYCFMASNALAIAFSMVVFAYGAWLYHKRSQYYELLSPSLYVDVCRIMMVISVMAMANCCIAIYSVLRELRCLIYSFSTASVILCFSLLIGGIMGIVFRQKLEQTPLQLKMLTSLKELYGSTDMPAITVAWDSLQSEYLQMAYALQGTQTGFSRILVRTICYRWHLIILISCVPERLEECMNMSSTMEKNMTIFREEMGSTGIENSKNSSKPYYAETCHWPFRADLLSVVFVAAWLSIGCSLYLLVPAVFALLYARLIKK